MNNKSIIIYSIAPILRSLKEFRAYVLQFLIRQILFVCLFEILIRCIEIGFVQ